MWNRFAIAIKIWYFALSIMQRPKREHTQQSTSLSILSPNYARFQFNDLLEFLNTGISRIANPDATAGSIWKTVDRSDVQRRFKSFVVQWMECGQNLNSLFRRNRILAENCMHGKTLLIPDRDGVPQLAWSPILSDDMTIPVERAALTHFTRLVVNPLALTLAGPCARCGRFYAKRTKRQKAYCSRSCGLASTALIATRKRRDEAKLEKIQRAEREIREWTRVHSHEPWKKWVSARTANQITVKWLTRAVREGLIARPLGGG